MAKVYLFRKIPTPNETQAQIFEDAVSSMVNDVLQGSTSSIFVYGDSMSTESESDSANLGMSGDMVSTEDLKSRNLLQRIVNNIFRHVYTMELTMEINISIRHIELTMKENTLDIIENIGTDEFAKHLMNKEHFVSTPKDVYAYMEKTWKRCLECRGTEHEQKADEPVKHSHFTLHVKQTNLEQSRKMHGKLNMVYLTGSSSITDMNTNMWALYKIVSALANNKKTHMRYHNIRLTRLLKDMLGSAEMTVLIYYATPLVELLPEQSSTCEMSPDVWRSFYNREREKYRRLKERVLNLEFWGSNEEKLQLDELLESLEECSSSTELQSSTSTSVADELSRTQQLGALLQEKQCELERNAELCQRLEEKCAMQAKLLEEQRTLEMEMQQIKIEAQLSMDELRELKRIIEQLAHSHEQTLSQLKQKDQVLARINGLLRKANEQLKQQKTSFKLKLNEYSEMFNNLWRQQAATMQLQEEQREQQLSDMFDTVWKELESSHQKQLDKLKQQAEQKEQELQQLQRRDQQSLEVAKHRQK